MLQKGSVRWDFNEIFMSLFRLIGFCNCLIMRVMGGVGGCNYANSQVYKFIKVKRGTTGDERHYISHIS